MAAPSAPTTPAVLVLPAAPTVGALAMLAPVCVNGGQAITWSWQAAPAAGYLLQVSSSSRRLPDGTLESPDIFNGTVDPGSTAFTVAATPGQPFFAVVLPLLASGAADSNRVSGLVDADCVTPGAGSRPVPETQPTVSVAPATPAANAAAPTEPPAAPSDLIATPLDASEVRLDWASNSDDEAGFAIDDGYSVVAQVPAGTTTITLVGLDPDGPYCAAVYAYNQAGASELSNMVCFTTIQEAGDGS